MQRYNISSVENKVLPLEYYLQDNVVSVAKDLLGKVMVSDINGITTAGIITETEAYSYIEKGCHAYGKKRTSRNAIMFEKGGNAYVYLCYGIHHLFNIVMNTTDEPEAILIRAIHPVLGLPDMLARRNQPRLLKDTFIGPGKVTQALGINMSQNKTSLISGAVKILDAGIVSNDILVSPRIGIDYAGEDAKLPWRFVLQDAAELLGK